MKKKRLSKKEQQIEKLKNDSDFIEVKLLNLIDQCRKQNISLLLLIHYLTTTATTLISCIESLPKK